MQTYWSNNGKSYNAKTYQTHVSAEQTDKGWDVGFEDTLWASGLSREEAIKQTNEIAIRFGTKRYKADQSEFDFLED